VRSGTRYPSGVHDMTSHLIVMFPLGSRGSKASACRITVSIQANCCIGSYIYSGSAGQLPACLLDVDFENQHD
jgi:hypothetical protein